MRKPSDLERDARLDQLERELGPRLRGAWQRHVPRPEFAAELRHTLLTAAEARTPIRPNRLRTIRSRAWAALAAVLVVGAVAGTALFAYRPLTASADEQVLTQVQTEALGEFAAAPAGCQGAPGPDKLSGPPDPTQPDTNPTELSDKLAQALGVSGDRVRQAMLDTVRADMPASLPPDPMTAIAQQLGVSRDQVCSAFFDSKVIGIGFGFGGVAAPGGLPTGGLPAKPPATPAPPQGFLNLSSATNEQLSGPAQRLGVTPDKLRAAIQAAIPNQPPALPKPPNPDETINRFAQNLGMSPDRVKAAITQVEGPNRFYFAVPIPSFGK